MEHITERILHAEMCNATVGHFYPAPDRRFAEVKRAGEIMDIIKGKISSVLEAACGQKTYGEPVLRGIFGSDRSESLGIANEIMHGPGAGCPAGKACVPFEYNRHTACRECNQVRDFNPNAGV